MKISSAFFRKLFFFLFVSFFGFAGPSFSQDFIPCLDPSDCVDMTVDPPPDKRIKIRNQEFFAGDCEVEEGIVPIGKRRLLRFDAILPNVGGRALDIGNPEGANFPYGILFDTGNCHGHPHIRDWTDYRLWEIGDYSQWEVFKAQPENLGIKSRDLLDLLAENQDISPVSVAINGWCIIDEKQVFSPADPRTYTSCHTNQGLGVGWANFYHLNLYYQFIDITGVPPGSYILEIEVNAKRLVQEEGDNYANNFATVLVKIPGKGSGRGRGKKNGK